MSNSSRKGGISVLTVLFIIFLVLKLAGVGDVAHWSWVWVTSPLWIPIACSVAIFTFFGVIFLLVLVVALCCGSRVYVKKSHGEKECAKSLARARDVSNLPKKR